MILDTVDDVQNVGVGEEAVWALLDEFRRKFPRYSDMALRELATGLKLRTSELITVATGTLWTSGDPGEPEMSCDACVLAFCQVLSRHHPSIPGLKAYVLRTFA